MDIYREIEREYEVLRDREDRALDERRQALYETLPVIGEMDEEIRRLGFQAVRRSLTGGEDVDSLGLEIKALGEMKKKILKEAGLPEDYLEVHRRCRKCMDRGVLSDGSRCECYTQRLAERLYDMSNLKYVLEKENFDKFRLELFSEAVDPKEGISPRENMVFIMEVARDFLRTFSEKNDRNLLFYGPTGLGKTFLSNCIAKELLDRGHTVIYQTAFTILDILEKRRFYREEYRNSEVSYRLLFDAELLIIDDLGTEMANQFTNSEIFNIVNTRLLRGKKTLISTNLNPSELAATYSDRTFSRIFQKFVPLKFFGKDLRWEQ